MKTTTFTNEINIVIGSWGSYNACNERALGSQWMDLASFTSWDEIEEELTRQGFELQGPDEELFVQDIENLPSNAANWDHMSPQRLFENLKESGVLDNRDKYDTLLAYLEVRCFSDFEDLVSRYGSRWDDDILIYRNYDWEQYGREVYACSGYEVPDFLLDYIDFERFGESMRYDGVEEFSDGLIDIR